MGGELLLLCLGLVQEEGEVLYQGLLIVLGVDRVLEYPEHQVYSLQVSF